MRTPPNSPFNSQLCQYLLVSDFLSPTSSCECHVERLRYNGMLFLKILAFLQILERKESKILLKPIACLMKDYHNTSWAILWEVCSMSKLALTKYIKENFIWSLTTVYYLVFFLGKKDNFWPHLYLCSASHAENI